MTDHEFAELCRADGWGAPRQVDYAPNQRPEPHAHDFDAWVLLLDGAVTIATPDGDEVLGPGAPCHVPAGRVHAEVGGPDGGRGLVATRTPTP